MLNVLNAEQLMQLEVLVRQLNEVAEREWRVMFNYNFEVVQNYIRLPRDPRMRLEATIPNPLPSFQPLTVADVLGRFNQASREHHSRFRYIVWSFLEDWTIMNHVYWDFETRRQNTNPIISFLQNLMFDE
jgi:hypothetical protein